MRSMSSPWPRSTVKVMTSRLYFSWSHGTMTLVSSPPEYAKMTLLRSFVPPWLRVGGLSPPPLGGRVRGGGGGRTPCLHYTYTPHPSPPPQGGREFCPLALISSVPQPPAPA